MNWSLGNYWYLLLLLLLPLLGVLLISFIKWRMARRHLFAEERFQKVLFSEPSGFSKMVPWLYILGIFFLIMSIVDVVSGSEQVKSQQKMNNVVLLLDVSNSMNAEDLQPSRLSVAKNIMVSTIQQLKNDRVGMVAFAGEARSIMPLTTDFSAAETYISGIETLMLQVQGTDFLKGMEEAARKFKNTPKGAKQVVLISDGEDNEGNSKAAIDLAKKEGIRVITIGVGTDEGAPVPEYIYGQLMGYKETGYGETVISKRETKALKEMAEETRGVYIDGNQGDNVAQQLVANLQQGGGATDVLVDSQNSIRYYQYFLAVSVFFFFLIYLFNPKRDLNV